MTYLQFIVLSGLIYIAPHINKSVGLVIGTFFAVYGIVLWVLPTLSPEHKPMNAPETAAPKPTEDGK